MIQLTGFNIAAVVVLVISFAAVVLIKIFNRLLPLRFHRAINVLLTIAATVMSFWMVQQNGLTNNYYANGGYFWVPDPGRHACGGPYVAGAAECEAKLWEQWIHESAEADQRYVTWFMTPPPLRPTCDWVTPRLCDALQTAPALGSWVTYVLSILAMLVISLLPLVIIRLLINGSVFPRRNQVVDSAAP